MRIMLTAEQIQQRVVELAAQVTADYRERQPLTVIGVLTGSLMFLADLVRQLPLPVRIGFIQASSYRGAATTPGELHVQAELLPELAGRHVLLLDDILDTGHTLQRLAAELRARPILSLRVGVLLRKLGRQRVPFEPDYCGFSIDDAFVVGYGLDHNDEYRHLPCIAELTADRV